MRRKIATLSPVAHVRDVPGCVRLEPGSIFHGVRVPRRIAVYDVRCPESDAGNVRAPWGETLWSGERAMYATDLKTGFLSDDVGRPVSCSSYRDHRTEDGATDGMLGIRRLFARCFREYRRNVRDPMFRKNGEVTELDSGGSTVTAPVIADLGNFGYGIAGRYIGTRFFPGTPNPKYRRTVGARR